MQRHLATYFHLKFIRHAGFSWFFFPFGSKSIFLCDFLLTFWRRFFLAMEILLNSKSVPFAFLLQFLHSVKCWGLLAEFIMHFFCIYCALFMHYLCSSFPFFCMSYAVLICTSYAVFKRGFMKASCRTPLFCDPQTETKLHASPIWNIKIQQNLYSRQLQIVFIQKCKLKCVWAHGS